MMPSSIYACNACNYELFNNLEIVIHDKKKNVREMNLHDEIKSHCGSSVTSRHKSMPAFAFDKNHAKKMSSSRRFLNKDSLSNLESDNLSECDFEAATVVSVGGTDIPKRDFLTFKAF
jgi:hypothetical protein